MFACVCTCNFCTHTSVYRLDILRTSEASVYMYVCARAKGMYLVLRVYLCTWAKRLYMYVSIYVHTRFARVFIHS